MKLRNQLGILLLLIIFIVSITSFVFRDYIYNYFRDSQPNITNSIESHSYIRNYDFQNYIPSTELSKSYPAGYCCCEYTYQGDIRVEPGVFSFADCKTKNGACIEYDPANCNNEDPNSWQPCCHP